MTKYVSDTAAGKSVSAYVILNRKGEHVATVKAHWGNSRCLVNVHCDKAGFQAATASGYGYDKFSAALSHCTIDGHEMSDHCGKALKPPKGRFVWPRDAKAPKGYWFVNWCTVDAKTGNRRDSYHWRDLALRIWREENGLDESTYPESQETWDYVARNGRRLASEASERGDTAEGWQDCYRLVGLDYLKALGYRVIQAI